MGGLPLALHLAGRCIAALTRLPPVPEVDVPTTFDHYRRIFEREFRQLDELHALSGALHDRERLTRTWEISLDLLADIGVEHARALLRLLASFAQAPMPYALLDAKVLAASLELNAITELEMARTLTALQSFGLVRERLSSVTPMYTVPSRGACYCTPSSVTPVATKQSRSLPLANVLLCIALLNNVDTKIRPERPYDLSLLHAFEAHHAFAADQAATDLML